MEQQNLIDPNVPSSHYIFHSLFQIRVKQEALQVEADLLRFGARSTGFQQYDNQLFGQYTVCYLPISRMAEIFDKGHDVFLVDHSDAKRVYEYIQNHLECWMGMISGGVNTIPAPYDDLRLLDRFATKVYGVAAHQYGTGDTQTTFGRWMAQFSDLSESAFLPTATDAPDVPEVKPRASMQDALLEHQSRLYR